MIIGFIFFTIIIFLIIASIFNNIGIQSTVESYGLRSTNNTNYGFIHPFYLQQTVNDDLDELVLHNNHYKMYGYIPSPYYIEFGEGSPYLKHSKPAPYYTNNPMYDYNSLPKYNFKKINTNTIKPKPFYPYAFIKRYTDRCSNNRCLL
jgi:hypothetical protein